MALPTLKEQLKPFEWKIIEDTIEACGGNKVRAAKRLGIDRKTLYNKIAEHKNRAFQYYYGPEDNNGL